MSPTGGRSSPPTGEGFLTPPTAAADPHLLDTDFDGTLTEAQHKHLLGCGWCQQRADQARSHPDLADEEEFMAAARARVAAGPGDAIRRLTTLTAGLHTLIATRDTRDDVQIGQLWRLRWNDNVELALVLAIDAWWVTIAPVTTDVAAADDYSPLLPAEATVLGVPVALCVSLECVVPLYTFDQLIASTRRSRQPDGTSLERLPSPDVLRDVWRAWRRGDAPPPQLAYGESVLDGDLDRRELRDAVAAAYTPLASASAAGPGEPARTAPASLLDMLAGLNLSLREMTQRSGLEANVFVRVKQGGRVTAEEAPALARLLDTDAETVLAANPPLDEDLFVEVSRPVWRPQLRNLAEHRQSTEADQRWHLAEAVAASRRRTTHSGMDPQARPESAEGGPTEWEPLVQMHLNAELAALADSDPQPSWPAGGI